MKPSETPPVRVELQNGKKTKPRFLFLSFFLFAMLRLSNLAFDEKRKNESAPNELWKKWALFMTILCYVLANQHGNLMFEWKRTTD